MSAKTWKPRVHTERLTQRTQRRVQALASVDAAPEHAPAPELPRHLEDSIARIVEKFQRLYDVYGQSWTTRLEVAVDRLLAAGGVQ